MTVLNDIKDKLIFQKDIVEKKAFLEKHKKEIYLLLDSKDIDAIDIQDIGLKINEIKQNTMESRDNDEFARKGGEAYIRFLNDIKDHLLISLKSKSVSNIPTDNKIEDKKLITGITVKASEQKAEEINKNVVIPQNKEYEKIKKMKKIGQGTELKKIEHPPKIQEYMNHVEKVFGIKDIEKNNYDILFERISFRGIEEKTLIDTLNTLKGFKNDIDKGWYKSMNYLLVTKIGNRLNRIKENKTKLKIDKENRHNLDLIKKNISSIIPKLKEFKKNIDSNNDIDKGKLNESYNKLKQDIETIVNNIEFKGEKGGGLKIKLNHQIYKWISIYNDMPNEKINLAKKRGFFTGDIDDLIKELKNY